MYVLGIETSCDETGVAVYDTSAGLLAHRVYSQVGIHADFGGVVPELASRDHVRKTIPLVDAVLTAAGLAKGQVDGVAYTAGPGLVGALLVGAAIGRSLAWAWGVPAVAVHHMEGHLLAPMMGQEGPTPPFVALLVSGGHTQLVEVLAVGRYRLLGDSIDDAAGEAFDKTAKLLGLPYPGGPELARLAVHGVSGRYRFPRPMTDRPGLDFSFSGLKTFALNTLQRELERADGAEAQEQVRADIARAFEDAVVETLVIKCRRALDATGCSSLVLAGGVSANQSLRQRMREKIVAYGARVHYPPVELCTDNGAMIAFAGAQRLMAGQTEPLRFTCTPRWHLESLPPVRSGSG